MPLLKSAYDIAVVGAGVFGAWTASHLHRAGQSVVLLDAWGAGHSRASSGGESRVIRMGYGADAIYTRMALRSLALWQDLAERTGQVLFHRTGVLWMAREDDHTALPPASIWRQPEYRWRSFVAPSSSRGFP